MATMTSKGRSGALRTLAAVVGVGATLVVGSAEAVADELPPGCTTADMTGVMSGVAAATAVYLFGHPDVNDFFTGLQGLPKTEVRDRTEAYLAENPGVRADLEGIRAPSRDFRDRCGLPQRALILADSL